MHVVPPPSGTGQSLAPSVSSVCVVPHAEDELRLANSHSVAPHRFAQRHERTPERLQPLPPRPLDGVDGRGDRAAGGTSPALQPQRTLFPRASSASCAQTPPSGSSGPMRSGARMPSLPRAPIGKPQSSRGRAPTLTPSSATSRLAASGPTRTPREPSRRPKCLRRARPLHRDGREVTIAE